MEFITEQLKLLGLNARETRVFVALVTFGRMNMTTISSRANVARTSVDAIVRRLERQGIVTREKVGKHWEYFVNLESVTERIEFLHAKLHPAGSQLHAKAINDEKKVISSANTCQATLESHFLSHRSERVTMLLSVLGSGRERVVEFEHCLTIARRAGIRLELLTCDHVASAFSDYARELLALISSTELRLNILPQAYCLSGVDILAFRDIALALDHHTPKLEVITAPLAVTAINHLMFVSRETGWSIDLRQFLESRIEVKQNS